MATSYRFVVMEGPPADYPGRFRAAIEKLDVRAEIESFPHMWSREISSSKIKMIRELIRRRSPDERVCFCPGSLELFLEEPDMSFQFSAYRSWFDPSRTTVLPHPWSSIVPKDDERLRWRAKPPLSVGFMGTTYADSRIGRFASALPMPLKRRILEGRLRRSADRLAWLYEHRVPFHFLPTFARFEMLEAVARAPWPKSAILEIVDTGGFDGSDLRKRAFADHLERMTYVLCPRGCENYSFRVYEALRFGRVPVIIDTEMVLPGMVDWKKVALIVPNEESDQVHLRIIEDHCGRDAEQFLDRQEAALAASACLSEGGWLSETVREALAKLSGLPVAPNGG